MSDEPVGVIGIFTIDNIYVYRIHYFMAFSQEEIDTLATKTGQFERYVEITESTMTKGNGLFDKLAASYIAASEIGVDLVSSFAIKDLSDGMSATVYGIIISDLEVTSYTRRSGKEGKMMKFGMRDFSGIIQVVIWDEKIMEMLSETKTGRDSRIKIANGIVKDGRFGKQISPGKWGAVIPEPEEFPDMTIEGTVEETITPLEAIEVGGIYRVAGEIITVFDLREFKRRTTDTTGHVLNLIIMDKTSSMKMVLWDDLAIKCSGLTQGQNVLFGDFSARKNRDIIELHSTYRSSVTMTET